MDFQLLHECKGSGARAGILSTSHGQIETPIFMPVGTQATVKSVLQEEIEKLGAQIILGNTFHLYLRPGHEIIRKAGGLHKFMSWDRPILTDSGGYQVYSLSAIRKITEEGVSFQSPIDGSSHFFSPERAIEIQQSIGADIIMAFDECTPYPCDYDYARNSMHLTHRWLDRCFEYSASYASPHPYSQLLAPIVQGSTYGNLRKMSAEYIAEKNAVVNAIGGLSVGEPAPDLYEMTSLVCDILPREKARYLMGVGTPSNILECISLGVDMFDCVIPTRNARHGLLYTREGEIQIKNAKWKEDFSVLDPTMNNGVSNRYSKAYLRHLFNVKEELAFQLASIHNLSFYIWLVKEARNQILKDNFSRWKSSIVQKFDHRL